MKRTAAISLFTLAILFTAGVVWALPTPASIDGDPGDWNDATCLVDEGGVDDETSPTRADITEFCAHVDTSNMYVAMAWDHTDFSGGNASTAGTRLDVDGDGLFDFIVLATLEHDSVSDSLAIQKYTVGSCDAAGACTNTDDVCSSTGGGGGLCTGALSATSALWDDPFDPTPGHGSGNVCGGANCTTHDAFVELAIPWSVLGLTGPPSPHVFGDYGSYPSGPGQGAKDAVSSGNGITCQPDGTCFVSTPTAVTIGFLGATPQRGFLFAVLFGAGLLSVATVLLLGRIHLHEIWGRIRRP